MTKEAKGFGGQLCHKATAPYEKRQGAIKKKATAEADQPPLYDDVSEKTRQREQA